MTGEIFKVGAIVRLKSGGPLMTASEIGSNDGEPWIWCVWFDDGGNENRGDYPAAALQAADD